MTSDIGNYARHARYWEWGGYDRAPEHDYWYQYARQYGANVLVPMCALGETGAYMAERGMNVTAFDITPEMIREGRERFGHIENLALLEGDVRDFRFDIPPADFCFCVDFGHLLTLGDVKKALVCINNHLRDGGCLVIETGLRMPGEESKVYPTQTFTPTRQVYPGLRVWKTGDTRIDGETGRCYITQTFYAEDESGNIESFDHAFYLQSYTREEWLEAFRECGFEVAGEAESREVESWQGGGGGFRIFRAVKSTVAKKGAEKRPKAPEHNLRHVRIDLDKDRDYLLERHCRTNYECDTPWARRVSYEEYRARWFSWPGQQSGFLSALEVSMEDARTLAEILRNEQGEAVGYLWAPFHGEDDRFVWMDVQDIFVKEAFRNTGVASYLLDYAEQAARRNGAKVIRSGTGCENIKSQGLHCKMGYYQYRMEYEKVLQEDTQDG